MKKISLIVSCAVLISLLGVSVVEASPWPDLSGLRDAVNDAARAAAQAAAAAVEQAHQDHCNAIKQRIEAKTDYFHAYADGNSLGYSQLLSTLARTISDAKSRGYNTNKLETYYDELNDKVGSFNSAASTFYMRALDAKNKACIGANDANNARNLAATRLSLHKMKDMALEIKDYYKNTIKPEILDMRTQEYVEN
jgi:hypothetical protein